MSELRDVEKLQDGCYYPGCSSERGAGKFCGAHASSKPKKKVAKKSPPKAKKAAPSKKKIAAKKVKAAPPKKVVVKTKKKTGGPGSGTDAQRRAAQAARQYERVPWRETIAAFRKAKGKDMTQDLSSPGSAQVTRVRLNKSGYCKGLYIWTEGHTICITKDKKRFIKRKETN